MNELAAVRVTERDGVWVTTVRGELDISNADEFSAAIVEAVPNEATGIILDLTETTYLDSAAIRVLFELGRRAQTRQQALRAVIPAASPIRRVVELTRLDSLLPVDADLETALAALSTG